MDSTVSSGVGAKLDLQRQAREENINKRAIEVAKKKDRKALMELIQERDRMLWERNNQRKSENHSRLIADPVIATALNDSNRGSGAQSDVLNLADSLPRDNSAAAAHRMLTSSGDDEFTMYRQTNPTKVSSNGNVLQTTGGNEQ